MKGIVNSPALGAVVVASVMLTGAAVAGAQTITIDFEGFAEETPITDQYADSGVELYLVDVDAEPIIATEGQPGVAWVTNYPTRRWDVAVSGTNSLTDTPHMSDYGAVFATPVEEVSLAVSDFGDCISVVSVGEPVTAQLIAYDADGGVVDSDAFTIDRFRGGSVEDGNVAFLSVSGAGIVRVETSGLDVDCGQAIDDLTFTVSDDDTDCDGVPDDDDMCPGTWPTDPDAGVPSVRLGMNRWAEMDGDGVFDTRSPEGQGPDLSFTIEDTAGCNCAQIIENLELGEGHSKFGCSISAMRDWVALVEDSEASATGDSPTSSKGRVAAADEPVAGCSIGAGQSGRGGWGVLVLVLTVLALRCRRRATCQKATC